MSQTLTKTQTIQSLLTKYSGQIKAALPRHLTPERMARLALTTVRRNRLLGQADPVSLFGAIIECSQLGLEPGRGAHLVPFRNKRRGTIEVQMIPDYRGLMDLARRSGGVGEFYAQEVRAGDEFEYEYGTGKHLRHKPGVHRGEITHCYAYAAATDGAWNQFEVMSLAEVDEIRARSKAGDDGPWVTDYPAMARKTVIKRLCKVLPSSAELSQAIQMDDQHAAGMSQANRAVIDADFLAEEDDADAPPAREDDLQPKAKTETMKEYINPTRETKPPKPPESDGKRGRRQKAEQWQTGQPETPPAPSVDDIDTLLAKAETGDDLDVAIDLIGSIADPGERAQLVRLADDTHARILGEKKPPRDPQHREAPAMGISGGQIAVLRKKLEEANKPESALCEAMAVSALAQIKAADFNRALAWISGAE